jgi:hypothetical protein
MIVGIMSRDPLQAKQNNGYGMTNRVIYSEYDAQIFSTQ